MFFVISLCIISGILVSIPIIKHNRYKQISAYTTPPNINALVVNSELKINDIEKQKIHKILEKHITSIELAKFIFGDISDKNIFRKILINKWAFLEAKKREKYYEEKMTLSEIKNWIQYYKEMTASWKLENVIRTLVHIEKELIYFEIVPILGKDRAEKYIQSIADLDCWRAIWKK